MNIAHILVIGGGPAGSFAAAALAREGFEVTLLERENFPRYHIGESMLPSCRPFLRFIGAEQKVKDYGFSVKVGAAFKFNQTKREGYTDFINPDPNRAAWNVTRAEFDEILLRNAGENGVRVCEGISVDSIGFSGENAKQPVSAAWTSDTGASGQVKFKWLVDASGRTGIMATKYLKNRKFNQALRNIAFWGYWTGAGKYAPGTDRENATWLEALVDESGWAWFIPLHGGRVSVGIVLKEDISRAKRARVQGPNVNFQHYHDQLKLAPGVTRLLGNATLVGEVKTAGDYSYASSHYAGPNYRIAGDAGCFASILRVIVGIILRFTQIDPFFSSGVHLAFGGALSAASTIAASIRGQCTEDEAIRFHNERTGTSYTRFLLIVLTAYRQMTSQSVPVLSDIDEDNFDRAFDFLRPVIQGAADTDGTVTEAALQSTMDFCQNALGLSNPDMHKEVAKRLDSSPMVDHAGFGGEIFNGLSIRLKRGSLGLERTPVAAEARKNGHDFRRDLARL
ncbi:putative halogenase [Mycena albidolilacea]|uniref:Halogenase n=1 Tax=Mycena albidolilacea TaxID=1033008 RepID=A0AAD6ZPT9_9AGAR|nr:putative halogenase [Mycena albidolilacea]